MFDKEAGVNAIFSCSKVKIYVLNVVYARKGTKLYCRKTTDGVPDEDVR